MISRRTVTLDVPEKSLDKVPKKKLFLARKRKK
jgi:hypothetical protein